MSWNGIDILLKYLNLINISPMKKIWPTLAQHTLISHQIDDYMLKIQYWYGNWYNMLMAS
jgi:hypothetical protein